MGYKGPAAMKKLPPGCDIPARGRPVRGIGVRVVGQVVAHTHHISLGLGGG